MSTDYDAACVTHRTRIHLGQRMGGIDSFGWGSKDESGRADVAAWLFRHVNGGCLVVLSNSEETPDEYATAPDFTNHP